MPKCTDAAPMDYLSIIWSIIKRRLQKSEIYSFAGIKRAMIEAEAVYYQQGN